MAVESEGSSRCARHCCILDCIPDVEPPSDTVDYGANALRYDLLDGFTEDPDLEDDSGGTVIYFTNHLRYDLLDGFTEDPDLEED